MKGERQTKTGNATIMGRRRRRVFPLAAPGLCRSLKSNATLMVCDSHLLFHAAPQNNATPEHLLTVAGRQLFELVLVSFGLFHGLLLLRYGVEEDGLTG